MTIDEPGSSSSATCPHLRQIKWSSVNSRFSTKEAKNSLVRGSYTCDECNFKMPHVWACIHNGCDFVGCGRNQARHALGHFEEKNKLKDKEQYEKSKKYGHTLSVNLQTGMVWCYACDRELLPFEDVDAGVSEEDAAHLKSFVPLLLNPVNPENVAVPEKMKEKEKGKAKEKDKERGVAGLENLGNTCYMNAALQCLSNCPSLTNYFLTCSHYTSLRPHHSIADTYQGVVQAVWDGKSEVVNPIDFLRDVKQANPMFRGSAQQDSQEFLRFFLDKLQEEIKRPVPGPRPAAGDDSPSASSSSAPSISWSGGSHQAATGKSSSKKDKSGKTGKKGRFGKFASKFQRQSGTPSPTAAGPAAPISASTSAPTIDIPSTHVSGSAPGTPTAEMTSSSLSSSAGSTASSSSSSSASSASQGAVEDPEAEPAKEGGDQASPRKKKKKRSQKKKKDRKRRRADDDGLEQPEADPTLPQEKEAMTIEVVQPEKEEPSRKEQLKTQSESEGDSPTPEPAAAPSLAPAAAPSLAPAAAPSPPASPVPAEAPTEAAAVPPRIKYSSIVSETFEGLLTSTVKCQVCSKVSVTNDPFYDLSVQLVRKAEYSFAGYLSELFGFGSQTLRLTDCLDAFFSTEELTGNDQYYCGHCKQHTDSQKTFRLHTLPEVLCVHLKRFRHDSYFSSKITTPVSFPLDSLNLKAFCGRSEEGRQFDNTKYDVIGIINHRGGLGGGHYVAYCLNDLDGHWYEFDDSRVTRKSRAEVERVEAYVLFYRRRSADTPERQLLYPTLLAPQKAAGDGPAEPQVLVSQLWLNRWRHMVSPGPITNFDFLCEHGGFNSVKYGPVGDVTKFAEPLLRSAFDSLAQEFGTDGARPTDRLTPCATCEELDRRLKERRESERAMVKRLESTTIGASEYWHILSMSWLREWRAFLAGGNPPGPIRNEVLLTKEGEPRKFLKPDVDYMGVNEKVWKAITGIYGGGPVICREVVNIYSRAPH